MFENLHGGMPDASWNYATLPFHSGGMGLATAALLPDICYVASILSTFPKIQGMLKDASYLCPQLLNASAENIALILPESETVTAQGLIAKARESRSGSVHDIQQTQTELSQEWRSVLIAPDPKDTSPAAIRSRIRVNSVRSERA